MAKRLIDVDALEADLKRQCNERRCRRGDEMPGLQAPQGFHGRDKCAKNAKVLDGREVGLHATGANDFCSYGERKEGREC